MASKINFINEWLCDLKLRTILYTSIYGNKNLKWMKKQEIKKKKKESIKNLYTRLNFTQAYTVVFDKY